MTTERKNVLYDIAKYFILILFALIAVYLVYLAGFSTALIDYDERSYMIGDSFIINLLVLAAFLAVCCIVFYRSPKARRFIDRVNADERFSAKCRRICLGMIATAALLFVLTARINSIADQLDIMRTADEFLNGDYSAFEPGGYVNRYPNQLGIILVLCFFGNIFGTYNYLIFQACNVAALVTLYDAFAKLSDETGHSRFEGIAVIIASGLFLPAIFYTTFSYGTLIGLSLSVNGLKHAYYYTKTYKTKDLIWSAVLLFAALIAKTNYMIFVIGVLVFLVVRLIKRFDKRLFIPIVLTLCILLGTSKVVNGVTTLVTGMDVADGTNSWSWIAMGMSENDTRYNGWYSSYNYESYADAGYDSERQGAAAKAVVKDELREFLSHPAYAVKFFAGKNASQWNDPDYQSLWVNRTRLHYGEQPYLIYRLLSADGADRVAAVENYFQFILFFGALVYALFSKKKNDVDLFYEVTVIGGFIFHTFWEAKGQYTMPYVMLMIPLSVEGYRTALRGVKALKAGDKKQKSRPAAFAAAFLAIACIIGFGGKKLPLVGDVFLLGGDEEAYEQSLAYRRYERLKSGDYIISLPNGGSLAEGKKQPDAQFTRNLAISDGAQSVYIMQSKMSDTVIIRFSDDLYLSSAKLKAYEGSELCADVKSDTHDQRWCVHKSAMDGRVNLIYDSLWALTYDDASGTVCLSYFSDSADQQWILQSAK